MATIALPSRRSLDEAELAKRNPVPPAAEMMIMTLNTSNPTGSYQRFPTSKSNHPACHVLPYSLLDLHVQIAQIACLSCIFLPNKSRCYPTRSLFENVHILVHRFREIHQCLHTRCSCPFYTAPYQCRRATDFCTSYPGISGIRSRKVAGGRCHHFRVRLTRQPWPVRAPVAIRSRHPGRRWHGCRSW